MIGGFMSEIDKYNDVREWWERKKREINETIDKTMLSDKIDKEVLEAMKILLNNNVKIIERNEEIIN